MELDFTPLYWCAALVLVVVAVFAYVAGYVMGAW